MAVWIDTQVGRSSGRGDKEMREREREERLTGTPIGSASYCSVKRPNSCSSRTTSPSRAARGLCGPYKKERCPKSYVKGDNLEVGVGPSSAFCKGHLSMHLCIYTRKRIHMHAACRKGANGKRGCHIGTGAKLVRCEGCDQKKGSFL